MKPVCRNLPLAGTALLAAAALLVAAPAGAPAAPPMAGKYYEGPATKGGREAVTLQVSKSGKRLARFSVDIDRGCRRNGRDLYSGGSVWLRNHPIRKGGKFVLRRTIRYPQTGGWLKTRLRGRFVGDGSRFKGSVREKMYNPETRIRCDSGKVRFGGRVPERELINGNWTGMTGQSTPITFRITGAGLDRLQTELTLECSDGTRFTRAFPALEGPASVGSDGRISEATYGEETTARIDAVARRGAVTGTLRIEEFLYPNGPDGDEVYPCTTGDVAFEARPAG